MSFSNRVKGAKRFDMMNIQSFAQFGFSNSTRLAFEASHSPCSISLSMPRCAIKVAARCSSTPSGRLWSEKIKRLPNSHTLCATEEMPGLLQSISLNIDGFTTNLTLLLHTLPSRIFQTTGMVLVKAFTRAVISPMMKLIWLSFKGFTTNSASKSYSFARMKLCTNRAMLATIGSKAIAKAVRVNKENFTTLRALSLDLHNNNIAQVLVRSKIVGGAGVDVLGNRISGAIKVGLK